MAIIKRPVNAGPFVIREIECTTVACALADRQVHLHTHHYDHVGIAVTAEVELEVLRVARRTDGSLLSNNDEPVWLSMGKFRLAPGMWRNIEKGDMHGLTFLTAGVFFCQFPHRDNEGNVIDRYTGNKLAYV